MQQRPRAALARGDHLRPPHPRAGARPVLLRALAERLGAAGYTGAALKSLLRVTYPDDIGPLNHAPALERLRADRSPAGAMARLFFLEADEELRSVSAVLSPGQTQELVAAGILQRRQHLLRARLRLDPVGPHYLFSDRRFRRCDPGALRLGGTDPVYPPGSDSLLLRDVIVADTALRVLDLCTGTGVQALAFADRATRLVAVDINPRAAAMAQANAEVNGVDALAVRLGDLYAPVRGEQFDLIVANPPFVVSPYERGPAYHAGGPRGDRVLRRILAGWSRHLAPGGRGFAISHLALRSGDTLEQIAAPLFHGFPGRALVMNLEQGSGLDLAAAQALFAIDRGLAAYAREVHRWVEYLTRHRIAQIVLVVIAAVRDGSARVDVIDAQPRLLPVPLTPQPRQRLLDWLASP